MRHLRNGAAGLALVLAVFAVARADEDEEKIPLDKVPKAVMDAVKARFPDAQLIGASERLDPDRLHQEAILIAAKVDVREELDRLSAHVAQARHLLAQGHAVGRRLDFLSQELNRETNTLCSKSNDVELTNIGLELKNVVEQFREQVQNLE